jgi:peroxisomal membrane protein 2/protein Mpv17
MSEVVAMAGQAYMKQLQTHPLRTKAITSGVLAGCSDAVAQKISGVTKLQLRRLLLIAVRSVPCSLFFFSFRRTFLDLITDDYKGDLITERPHSHRTLGKPTKAGVLCAKDSNCYCIHPRITNN